MQPQWHTHILSNQCIIHHSCVQDVRVAVFADGNQGDEAKAAGADIVGGDELIEEIKKGLKKLCFSFFCN